MNLSKPIGGYFELELPSGTFFHSDGILLNSGRNCLEYILKTQNISMVYIPKFICDAIVEPFTKLDIPYKFYGINENLELVDEIELNDGEYILYANYFGLKDDYCQQLAQQYQDRLILDLSQAFYFKPDPLSQVFYSPRKFFGVPDGGVAYIDNPIPDIMPTDVSYDRMAHLLKRVDLGAEEAYEDFKANEQRISGQPIKKMSQLTKKILASINYESVRQKRIQNFDVLDKALGQRNKMHIGSGNTCPMIYPYWINDKDIKNRLINNKIFVASYWPNVLEWCQETELEYQLADSVIALPIDQRYSMQDMNIILDIINGS